MAKLSNEQIVDLLKTKGFKPVDITGYKNMTSEIVIECTSGHQTITNIKSFRMKGFACRKCEGGKVELGLKKPPVKKPGVNRVIGVDGATEKLGISVFDDGQLVFSKVIKIKGLPEERVCLAGDIFNQVIIPEWKPDHITFEDVQYQGNAQTYRLLSMLLGVLIYAAKKAKIEYNTVLAKSWRSSFGITGDRFRAKRAAIAMVKEMYGITVTDDEAEAILIGKHTVKKQKTMVRSKKLF